MQADLAKYRVLTARERENRYIEKLHNENEPTEKAPDDPMAADGRETQDDLDKHISPPPVPMPTQTENEAQEDAGTDDESEMGNESDADRELQRMDDALQAQRDTDNPQRAQQDMDSNTLRHNC